MPSITPTEAATELSVSKATVMREIHAENLMALLIRGTYRIETKALEQYKKDCQKATEAGRYKAPVSKSTRKPYTKRPKFDPFKECG